MKTEKLTKGFKILIVIIPIIILAFSAGYTAGFTKGVIWSIEIGLNFVNMSVDEEMIQRGVFQYKNNLDNCFRENPWEKKQ